MERRWRRDGHDGAVRSIVDLLLPPRCPGCGIEGAVICATCLVSLRRRLGEPAGAPIGLPVALPAGIVQLEWCSAFTGPARSAIHALKYDGERRLVEPLGALMAERWRRAGVGGEIVAHVPVHERRLRERGFDQAALLAAAAAAHLRLPAVPALERRTVTDAQHALGRAARARNVGNAFGIRPAAVGRVRGRWVIVVDDIMTTGATLAGCASALLDAGALAVSALTVARER